jgi:hypothetical protein
MTAGRAPLFAIRKDANIRHSGTSSQFRRRKADA